MTAKMAVIVPTRGRPENARRLVKAFEDTVLDAENTLLVFGVDSDDDRLREYLELPTDGVVVHVGPRLQMAGTLNQIARSVHQDYSILGFMGDDHLPRSVGWDNAIREAMGPGGIVYCNDLIQGANLPTEVFLDAEIVRRVGGFVPEGFTHLFLDNTWLEWGRRSGRLTYLDHVVIEHMHPIAHKTEWDDGYKEVNSGAVWEADEKRFNEYVASGQLAADVETIKDIA